MLSEIEGYKYPVSVLVCDYNPKLKDIIITLRSVLLQKGIKFQIVISDDGSKVNYFEAIRQYFEKMNF